MGRPKKIIKPTIEDQFAAVDIRMADGSVIPMRKNRRGGRKRNPLLHTSQLVNSVDVAMGDESTGDTVTIRMPIHREGALMMSYALACTMAETAEKWFVATLKEMEKTGQVPNTQEMKDMVGIVKSVQDTLVNSWQRANQQGATRKDAGTGIHAPVLNQFFKIDTLIATEDGKAPKFEDVLKTMHELKVTGTKSIRQLRDSQKDIKEIGMDTTDVDVVDDSEDEELENQDNGEDTDI